MNLLIFYNTLQKPLGNSSSSAITLEELKRWVLNFTIIRHFFRYTEVRFVTYNVDFIPRPFLLAVILRLMARHSCSFRDESGSVQPITWSGLGSIFWHFIKDFSRKATLLNRISQAVTRHSNNSNALAPLITFDISAQPVYLRTDLWFAISSGGSIGHIAGVLNNLDDFTGKTIFLSTDVISTVRKDIETHFIRPNRRFWDFDELPFLSFNDTAEDAAHKILLDKTLSFIYQRYSLYNYTGLNLARQYNIPFVLEYNGSEIWVARHWGRPLKYETLAQRIELLNLRSAHMIVVVSAPLKSELIQRGIPQEKILVNPNGVDPDRYNPDLDGSFIRRKYGLNDKVIIGFIGTFGKWHGAEVLAEAFGLLLKEYPAYRDSARLFMIGDGMTMPQVKEALTRHAVGEACVLTGRIPQENGPAYLAACDILVSPHVPNPDGTPFFGSPTKLFEYMAMGKGIVASDLDQIGEILEHEKTAWMVKPGDSDSLMLGLKKLIDDKELRVKLGKAARQEVVFKYTWKEHTRKIIEKLRKIAREKSPQ